MQNMYNLPKIRLVGVYPNTRMERLLVTATPPKDVVSEFPDLEQDFLLSVYRKAVDYYQPKIEKRTGVQLGRIDVWPYALLNQHRVDNFKKSLGFLRSFLHRRQIQKYSHAGEKIDEKFAREHMAAYHQNAIYVSFSTESSHEDWLAELVVHELAHALFEKLGGPTYNQRFRLSAEEEDHLSLINEGYATFAQNVWFRDLYPLGARIDVGYATGNPGTVYADGFERIKKVVKEHGMEVLMDIPSRWREF